jgi:hypothetical protein
LFATILSLESWFFSSFLFFRVKSKNCNKTTKKTATQEEKARESQRVSDSIQAVNNATALQKKKDAEAKQLADAAAKKPTETADNGAAVDQGDPATSNDQEIVDEDGTRLINKNGHQAILQQPDEQY